MFDTQKASILKRVSAFILDLILFAVISVGVMCVVSEIVSYNKYAQKLSDYYAECGDKFGVDLNVAPASEAELEKYKEANDYLNSIDDAVYTYNLIINLILVITTSGLLIGFLILEFAVPLILKNGQSIGKKVFGIGVMRVDGVKLTPIQLFVRTVLGKFTIETMVPVLIFVMIFFGRAGIVGIIVVTLIAALQLILVLVTKTNSLIHDLLAGTVAVDLNSQMIFDTTDDLIAYQKRVAAENAAKEPY